MPNLLEDPTPIIFLGIVVEAVLGIILLRTGRAAYLIAMGGVLALVLLGVLIERLVVTETERVEATLEGIRKAIEANDLPRALEYVADEARPARDWAAWVHGRVEITDAKIRNLTIAINRLTSPPTAKAHLTGLASLRDRWGEFPYRSYVGTFNVELQLIGDRWLITAVSEEHPARR